jgi:hypothetical protein
VTPLTIEQIDELLSCWDDWLRRVDENLLALESDPAYQTLGGRPGLRDRIAGATLERIAPALELVAALFSDRERLGATIDRARALRADLGFWGKQDKLAEIEKLLRGPSVVLGTVETPLARRSLLDGGPRDLAIEPEALLARMARSYEQARDAFLATSVAWRDLEPALTRIEGQVAALHEQAQRLGVDPKKLDALGYLDAKLDGLRGLIARDPLSVAATFEGHLAPKLALVREHLDHLEGARGRVTAAIEQARRKAEQVQATHEQAHAALDALGAAIELGEGAQALVVEDAVIAGLVRWLSTLGEQATGPSWAQAEAGLARWLQSAEQHLGRDTQAIHRAGALLARRSELAGRLSARRAQAASLVARGAHLPAAVDAMAAEAQRLLDERPCPIGRAAAAVEAYEQALSSASRR